MAMEQRKQEEQARKQEEEEKRQMLLASYKVTPYDILSDPFFLENAYLSIISSICYKFFYFICRFLFPPSPICSWRYSHK